ncbi:hypothetical protein GQ44DRAFT_739773 [Phaeosphaeriaceae sp. PMI808]|nr:hypothetical protein GQ44DRAFT_739773 [Phaeosphaeriaceae sp. PMI808]
MAHIQADAEADAGQHAPHGTKRPADTTLENDQRLSKRFDLLNLVDQNGTRLYIPVPGSSYPPPPTTTNTNTNTAANPNLPPNQTPPHPPPPPPRSPSPSTMHIEDTPHRIYIHDLAAELSDDSDSESSLPIFLPDIEKHLSRIPAHVLRGTGEPGVPQASAENQLVVYRVPTSLSVPEEKDGVRRAIVEARRRAREGGGGGAVGGIGTGGESVSVSAIGSGSGGKARDADADEMDID